MIMLKKEILEINHVLNNLKKLGSTKFKYFVLKNIELLKPTMDLFNEKDKENKTLLANFEKDRNDLIVQIGNKSEDGKVFIDINNEEMLHKFNEGLKELVEKHKDSLDAYEIQFKILRDTLEEESEDIIFKKISIEDFPTEGVSIEYIELLTKYNIIN